MKKFDYTITDELGLHARPASQLVKVAVTFSSNISVGTPAKSVDAKRIMGVMQLAAKKGNVLTISCEGEDEEAAMTALETFMNVNL
ncbi:MAG: HPr family phosphocarrier protein [Clostridium sp.]